MSLAAREDPLAVLEALDHLEVGPVELTRERLVAPYRVVSSAGTDTVKLIYRYESPVFDPDDPVAHNLASMISAQVALNYGLFCRRITFRGAFDHLDRNLITDMMENTAREIYVKKFLEPNPFVRGDAAGLPALRRERYSRAAIEFGEPPGERQQTAWSLWPTSTARHAVLSSGGKDSLLTHGLLDELGHEVHPVFVNESGRHWLTSLNAYRHFRSHVPNTARVWVNSDRVFAWMLRHLPFIRPDFADVRSDEYPIRLWTVAVFLFGALPILRKRHISRLLIGDEFDTTAKTSHGGIPHYDGLYDQSRYFDSALSRCFLSKGWGISQFSILRPLSELLIQRMLVERYPELQAHQVSCHAAHQKNERVHPCGRCEKCRRIVGMLLALGADPDRCGYTESQVRDCLASMVEKGVAQEEVGRRQLFHMLEARGLIKLPAGEKKRARAHPEVLKLRFDRQRSPIDAVPQDLRAPIYKILLSHADGAVRRSGNRWREIDLLGDVAITQDYAFETETPARPSGDPSGSPATPAGVAWGELNWPDAEERLDQVDGALLPVGAVEQHGPHLPLDTDAFDADYLARRVAEACSDPKPLVLPVVSYGVSYHHEGFRGTISITNESLALLIYDIGMGAARNGIRKLVIVNGHGGNSPSLNDAAQRINRDAHIFVCVDTGETSDVDIMAMTETPNDVHAGEIETSTTLAVRPQLVRTDRIRRVVPRFSNRYLSFTSQRGVAWYAHTKKLSPTGVMGDPTKATAEKGERIWQVMIAHLTALTEELKAMTLEEIYQRRY